MSSQNGQPERQGDNVILRLPGSVAEIEASPEGPEVGAFFDLDGTLVAGFTGVHDDPGPVAARPDERRRVHRHGAGRAQPPAGPLGVRGPDRQGRPDVARQLASATSTSSASDCSSSTSRSASIPEMRALVRAHMARGHTVVLSSSALTVQVEPVAKFLGIDNVLSNKFETDDDGLITGEVRTPDHLGTGQGACGAGLRGQERRRPDQELLLRRRRRGRRADVSGRQPAADQSRRQDGSRCRQTRLADPAGSPAAAAAVRSRSCAPWRASPRCCPPPQAASGSGC